MEVRFWGTRGSIAKPGPATIRYGGNTSCVEVRTAGGTLLVLDCGTGGHGLGQALAARPGGAARGHILITHTHWDHIQGLPFFAPLFVPGAQWDIYGPKGLSQSIRQTLAGQMEHAYFPITLDKFGATVRYHDLVEGSFEIDDVQVTTHYLNHPALTLGYRLRADGATVVYSCDHEPFVAAAASGEGELIGADSRHVQFLSRADLVIHDSQYLAAEYPVKVGWGHSTAEYVIHVCREARAKTVALTHHDPLRDDDAVDRILAEMRRRVEGLQPPLEVLAASEGLALRIAPDAASEPAGDVGRFPALGAIDAVTHPRPILVRMEEGLTREVVLEAIRLEGATPRLLARDEALPPVSAKHFSLVILQHRPPALDGLALARAIRRAEAAATVRVPIAIVTHAPDTPVLERDAATDWLMAPFSLSYARTKIRSWILRVATRWVRANTPADEAQRVEALRRLEILDTPAEERFDRLARIAAATFDMPIALVSLVDSDRQWFKSHVGLEASELPRDVAFCAHAVAQRADLIVPDAILDDRFADNPLVTGEARVRFYAGAPLILRDGRCIGTLCVMDHRPREPADREIAVLHELRDLVVAELEAQGTQG